jgi:hypothetical protein
LGEKELRNIAMKYLPEEKAGEYLPIINGYYETRRKRAFATDEFPRLLEQDHEELVGSLSSYMKPGETIYIWGIGLLGKRLLGWCEAVGVNVQAIIDTDPLKQHGMVDGIEIVGVDILREERHKVIVTPKEHESEIIRQLEEWGYEKQVDYVLFSEMMDCIYGHAAK